MKRITGSWRSAASGIPFVMVVANAATAAPTPKSNGYDLYVRAAKSLVAANPPVGAQFDPEDVKDAKVRAARYSLARKEAWLKQNKAAFTLFQQALKTPTVHPGFKPATDNSAELQALREMARAKLVEAHVRELRGDWAGGMQSRLDIVQMGNDTGRNGPLLASLVSFAVQGIARLGIWDAPQHLTLPETRAALSRLESLYARRARFGTVLQAERQFGLREWRAIVAGPRWREFSDRDDLSQDQVDALKNITPEAVLEHYEAQMKRQMALANRPFRTTHLRSRPSRDVIDALIETDYEKGKFGLSRDDAANALWLVTLALHAHKLEKGSYPASLNELVPRFIRAVPVDPFDGIKPLHYKRADQSYLLWSIGPDGVDDGGRAIQWPLGPKPSRPGLQLPLLMESSKGDFVAGKNR